MSKKEKKDCLVCHDTAFAIHYNGLTCKSCKSFFRRNANNATKLSCPFEGNCDVEKSTRRFCKKCRLLKCFEIGMKKELVFFHKKESPSAAVGQLEAQFALTSVEWELIKDVNEASKHFPDEYSLPRVPAIVDKVKIGASFPVLYLTRVVQFCKHFNAFKCLNEADRITIIKGFFTEILTTRFAYNYNSQTDSVLLIDNETTNQVIEFHLYRFNDVPLTNIEAFRAFFKSMNVAFEKDATIMSLLHMNFLFGKRLNLSCPEHIRYQYFRYNQLLRRYLMYKYQNVQRAEEQFAFLMAAMVDFLKINAIIHQIHSDIDPAKQLHVLTELFNLNAP